MSVRTRRVKKDLYENYDVGSRKLTTLVVG
jgi:hypothetical protein